MDRRGAKDARKRTSGLSWRPWRLSLWIAVSDAAERRVARVRPWFHGGGSPWRPPVDRERKTPGDALRTPGEARSAGRQTSSRSPPGYTNESRGEYHEALFTTWIGLPGRSAYTG
ncbi:uncharacterized protein SOCE836_081670 [Sorangium cellulosum]|uniref:Uncharacterized protein n=1 Tax=Sorangium cellulosum TaxID=56 RepID=A0A4P2R1Y2_SORCE|nr:uncharacterized protein SOCE836_081670 [Sorangium cellulosum]WCQ95265.1 hypothetical protein NQZ70_08041 [Sorangium sp. Soce836]